MKHNAGVTGYTELAEELRRVSTFAAIQKLLMRRYQ